MMYLSPYHEFCDKTFSRANHLGLKELYARDPNWNNISYVDAELSNMLAHKLDVVHCINGFIGEVYELDEHLLALECGDFDGQAGAANLLNEARQELGDLCYYQAQLQTLLINSPHKPSLMILGDSSADSLKHPLVTWDNSYELKLDDMSVFEFNGVVNEMAVWENSIAKKIEFMLNKTKKLIFYGHEGCLTQVLIDMSLIINGYRVYHLDYEIDSDNTLPSSHTMSYYRTLNRAKLEKRYPQGTFTPEDAAAKVDQAPSELEHRPF